MSNNQMIKYKENIFEKIIKKIKNNSIIKKLFLKIHLIQEEPKLEEDFESNKIATSEDRDAAENSFKESLKEHNTEQLNPKISSDDIHKALTEVRIILSGYDKNINKQIPQNFIDFIEEEYDKNYSPNIDKLKDINSQELLETTRVILAIIYKKYLMNYKGSQV